MPWITRALPNFLGLAGVLVAFFAGLGGAGVYVSRLRIVHDDFYWVFLFGGLVAGAVSLGWLCRKKKLEPPAGYLLPIGILLFAGALTTLAGLINVKLDRSPPRRHAVVVMHVDRHNGQDRCWVRNDALGAFWISMPGEGAVSKGSYIEVTTRSGLLGFEWIERVGPEPRPPGSLPARPYPDPPAPPPFDPETTPLEAPDPK